VAEFLQEVAWAGAAAGSLVAGASAAVAALNYHQSRRLAEEQRGYGTYADYLKLAFEHPAFSTVDTDADLDRLKKTPGSFETYEWYVSRMLWAFEQIFEIVGDDQAWRTSIEGQLQLHSPYLCGVFRMQHYAEDYAEPLKGLLLAVKRGANSRRIAS
jgi:hypothetical protein